MQVKTLQVLSCNRFIIYYQFHEHIVNNYSLELTFSNNLHKIYDHLSRNMHSMRDLFLNGISSLVSIL
jgi:hypothetical protein